MSRRTFTELLKRYQEGTLTEDERRIVEQWYAMIDEEPRVLSPDEWDIIGDRLWQKLEEETQSSASPAENPAGQGSRFLFPVRYAAAAAVFVAAALLIFLFNGRLTKPGLQGNSVQGELVYSRNT